MMAADNKKLAEEVRVLAEELICNLWEANTKTHSERLAITVSAFMKYGKRLYREGVEAMRDALVTEMDTGRLLEIAARLLSERKEGEK